MKKSMDAMTGLFLFLLFPASNSFAQSDITRVSTDGTAQTVAMVLRDGTVVGVDNISQAFYVVDEHGAMYEVSFHDAIARAEPNPSRRTALLQELRTSLSDRTTVGTLTNSTTPRPAESFPPSDPGPPMMPRWSGSGSFPPASPAFTHPGDLGGPCDLGPCTPYRYMDGRIFYMEDSHSGFIGHGSVAQQTAWANDQDHWQRHREGRCREAREGYVETAATGAVLGGACLAVETGVGAVACAGAGVLYVIQFRKARRAEKECTANYPGPGNW